jgi:hypothetical protein
MMNNSHVMFNAVPRMQLGDAEFDSKRQTPNIEIFTKNSVSSQQTEKVARRKQDRPLSLSVPAHK